MKNIRKQLLMMVFVLAMAGMMLSGCKSEEDTSETTQETSGKKGEMEGTLVSFTGGEIEVEKDKKDYVFDVSEALIKTTNMRTGDDIVVFYEGAVTGTDTSKAKVSFVEDLGNKNEDKEEKQVVGTLVGATMNTVTIKTNDGTELTFNSNNCEHHFKNGLREGNWIVITYIGELKGTNTQNIKVIKIQDDDENLVEEEKKAMNIKAVDETVYATAGVHIRKSYSTDSEVIGSLAQGASIKRTGVCENGWSRVVFNNTDAYIYGEYLTTQAPKANAAPAKTTGDKPATPQKQPASSTEAAPENPAQGSEPEPVQKPEEQPEAEHKEATGTVVDVSMSTLTVQIEEQTYTLNIMDAEHQYANGIQTGNTVKITYTGDLAGSDVIVIKVQDDDPNTSAKNAEYTGTVTDATMNTITIQMDDGAVMTFEKSEAQDNVGSIELGMRVTIVTDVTETAVKESILSAKEINAGE